MFKKIIKIAKSINLVKINKSVLICDKCNINLVKGHQDSYVCPNCETEKVLIKEF